MNESYLTPDVLAKRLEGAKKKGKGWMARCPAHDDKTPSLWIDPGYKATLVHCHTGCSTTEVLDAMGLRIEQLYHDYNPQAKPHTRAAQLLNETLIGQQPRTMDSLMPCQTLEDVLYRVVWAPPGVWAAVGVRWQERLAEPFPQVMEDWWFRVTNGIIGDLIAPRIEQGYDWSISRQRAMEARLWKEWEQCGQS